MHKKKSGQVVKVPECCLRAAVSHPRRQRLFLRYIIPSALSALFIFLLLRRCSRLRLVFLMHCYFFGVNDNDVFRGFHGKIAFKLSLFSCSSNDASVSLSCVSHTTLLFSTSLLYHAFIHAFTLYKLAIDFLSDYQHVAR